MSVYKRSESPYYQFEFHSKVFDTEALRAKLRAGKRKLLSETKEQKQSLQQKKRVACQKAP
jgi:hypothetical protein